MQRTEKGEGLGDWGVVSARGSSSTGAGAGRAGLCLQRPKNVAKTGRSTAHCVSLFPGDASSKPEKRPKVGRRTQRAPVETGKEADGRKSGRGSLTLRGRFRWTLDALRLIWAKGQKVLCTLSSYFSPNSRLRSLVGNRSSYRTCDSAVISTLGTGKIYTSRRAGAKATPTGTLLGTGGT